MHKINLICYRSDLSCTDADLPPTNKLYSFCTMYVSNKSVKQKRHSCEYECCTPDTHDTHTHTHKNCLINDKAKHQLKTNQPKDLALTHWYMHTHIHTCTYFFMQISLVAPHVGLPMDFL